MSPKPPSWNNLLSFVTRLGTKTSAAHLLADAIQHSYRDPSLLDENIEALYQTIADEYSELTASDVRQYSFDGIRELFPHKGDNPTLNELVEIMYPMETGYPMLSQFLAATHTYIDQHPDDFGL